MRRERRDRRRRLVLVKRVSAVVGMVVEHLTRVGVRRSVRLDPRVVDFINALREVREKVVDVLDVCRVVFGHDGRARRAVDRSRRGDGRKIARVEEERERVEAVDLLGD